MTPPISVRGIIPYNKGFSRHKIFVKTAGFVLQELFVGILFTQCHMPRKLDSALCMCICTYERMHMQGWNVHAQALFRHNQN